jgi:hypothetical protein
MINDLINEVDSNPNLALTQALLRQKLKEVIEKTKLEFDQIFQMIGD